MKHIYKETYRIRSNEIDINGNARLDAIANLLQEAAGNHAKKLQFDITDLHDSNHTWILHQLHIKMDRYPEWRDQITIETWPSSGDRLRAYRDFRILDLNKTELGVALTHWLIIDLNKRRPVRIPQEILDLGLDSANHVIPINSSKSPDYNGKVIKSAEFTVHHSDLDLNKHLNNTVYVRWLIDTIPTKYLIAKNFRELHVNFKSEAALNDLVLSELGNLTDNSYFFRLTRKKDDGIIANGEFTLFN
ncbi:MAG: acyl-[acyl-carrier-protein] thioesterase [Balneolaceae bacterium]